MSFVINGITSAADTFGKGVKKGGRAAAKGVQKAACAAAKGLKKGALAATRVPARIKSSVKRLKPSSKNQAPAAPQISPFERTINVSSTFDEALSEGNDNQFIKDCGRLHKALCYKGTQPLYEQYKKEFDSLYQDPTAPADSNEATHLFNKIEKDFRAFLKEKLGEQPRLTEEIMFWFGQSVLNSAAFRIYQHTAQIYGGALVADHETDSTEQVNLKGSPEEVLIESRAAIAYSLFIPEGKREPERLSHPIQCNLVATHKILQDKVAAKVDYEFTPVPSIENLEAHFNESLDSVMRHGSDFFASRKCFDSLTLQLDRYTLGHHGILLKEPLTVSEKQEVQITDDKFYRLVTKVAIYESFEFKGLTYKLPHPLACTIHAAHEIGKETRQHIEYGMKTHLDIDIMPLFSSTFSRFPIVGQLPENVSLKEAPACMEECLHSTMKTNYGFSFAKPATTVVAAPQEDPLDPKRTLLTEVAIYKTVECNGQSYELKDPVQIEMTTEIKDGKTSGVVDYALTVL